MLYENLVRKAEELSSRAAVDLAPLERWRQALPGRRRRWLDMLGLDPLPERHDLRVTVTGILDRGKYLVEKLHFQPVPGCRIAANLYRPRVVSAPLPGVVYVCGHSQRGKFHYQPHARWFGEHGYVCIILDPIQVGENAGVHHGTYLHGWWHWFSQGYSPAGVEVWAAMRAADYLQTRREVNPTRLGITGLSGGGTISWFAGAADPRFRVVAPSCQTGTMYQHIRDRTVDGHCDCTYWVNTEGWDFPDVACLIAPRPLLVTAATEDVLFRPYAFRDLVHRARKLYLDYGVGENIDLVEAVTPHGYSAKTRLAIFNWFEKHLKGSEDPVTDDITERNDTDQDLAVYPSRKPPRGDRLRQVDRVFMALADVPEPRARGEWARRRNRALRQLRNTTFRHLALPLPAPAYTIRLQGESGSHRYRSYEFESEPGVTVRMHVATPIRGPRPCPIVVGAMLPGARSPFCAQGAGTEGVSPAIAGFACVEVRGTGASAIGPGLEWTLRRSYPLVGVTLYERRTLDLLAALRVLRQEANTGDLVLYGQGYDAPMAIYAALLDPDAAECVLRDPVATHWAGGPEFLNVLKVGDLPANLALLCPRPVSFIDDMPAGYAWTQRCYARCGQADRFRVLKTLQDWHPTRAVR